MRFLPFLKAGAIYPPPLFPGEVVWTTDEQFLQHTERGWMSCGGYMVKETRGPAIKTAEAKKDLDPALGLRYNSGKVKFGLIPGHWTRVLAQILTVGAKKYAPRNWEKGLVHSEILDSLHRHLDSFLKGERYDPETKCHHLGHVAWNALALMTMDLKGLGTADLPTDDDVKTMED